MSQPRSLWTTDFSALAGPVIASERKTVDMKNLVLMLTELRFPPQRDQRGLSQSTETAILVAAVVLIAGGIVLAVTSFIDAKMSEIQ